MYSVKAHTSIIGDTGYNCHSRNFFKALDAFIPVQVRNFTVSSTWNGYSTDEAHEGEYYMDEQLRKMLVEQTLHTTEGRKEFPLYTKYGKNTFPDVDIVLNETNHHYFYDTYTRPKIAYNVWETTEQPQDFFEKLKEFDQVWVPTKWQRDCTIKQGIPAQKVKVVPEGVDTQMFRPRNRVVSNPIERPFRFVLIGRWDYRKSTLECIRAFANTFTEKDNVELVISVDNPFASDGLETTENRLNHFGISHSKIKIVHHLSKEDYVELLQSADVFLSCARSEGWNLPLIEAMACGIPAIYSNWGGQLEFAEGRGIPINIKGEISAGTQLDEYYSWTKGAPGFFAEPDFDDLSTKMKEVVKNFTVYKKKALEQSDEIREQFTWEKSAIIAKEILDNFMGKITSKKNVVSVIIARADTYKRKELLRKCIESIDTEIILATNYPVDAEIQSMVDCVIYENENPILLKDEFNLYGVGYYRWRQLENGEREYIPYEYEHSYAAYRLTRIGLEKAALLNKDIVHIINYDYEIDSLVLEQNEELLKSNDIVFYKHNEWDFDTPAYCSAFISGRLSPLVDYFTAYSTKEDFYTSMSGFNILELNLSSHFMKSPLNIIEFSIQDLKKTSKVNQESAGNIYSPYAPIDAKTFKKISDSVDCDKTTYHKYDEHYPMFIEKFRDSEINLFEIGLDAGKSMKVWEQYLPHAKIWGMDISKEYQTNRCNVFIGDQSNIEDLKRVTTLVPKCNVIVDDGSHVPEHQLKTFYYLFEHMLDWGGVYIIEDVECSYWKSNSKVYGYETGHLNLIDYFTTLNHKIHSHYNNEQNELHIHSITYGENCIIIQKKESPISHREYRFKSELPTHQIVSDEIDVTPKTVDENEITVHFVDGPFVEILGKNNKEYEVKFIDGDTEIYSTNLMNNQWARTSRKWFTNWIVSIDDKNGGNFIHKFDAEGKQVFIVLESASLGDTLAWIPYVDEFRKKWNCQVVVSTFHNHLFQSEYPDINFVNPGTIVENVYALYRLGVFYDNNSVDFSRHKTDFRECSLQKIACDILGLDYVEIRPKIKRIKPMESDKPYICIANHSTAQAKYWNNETGWQELVDYVKSLGYEVYLLSKEEDGYMNNRNPTGVIKIDNKSLDEIGSILLGSKGFVGLGSGLSWFAWALEVPTVLISGFSKPHQEMKEVYRVINEEVCHGCFARHLFDKGDWNWCPDHKGTPRQFECTKNISFDTVKPKLNQMLRI